MPFYDLYCSKCDEEYNISATISDKVEGRIPCPKCGSTELDTVYKAAPAYIKTGSDAMPSCANAGGCGGACPHGRGH